MHATREQPWFAAPLTSRTTERQKRGDGAVGKITVAGCKELSSELFERHRLPHREVDQQTERRKVLEGGMESSLVIVACRHRSIGQKVSDRGQPCLIIGGAVERI